MKMGLFLVLSAAIGLFCGMVRPLWKALLLDTILILLLTAIYAVI